ncbi:MAG: hypothetical protein AAB268_12355 [Elusimicrobiota bacterium]
MDPTSENAVGARPARRYLVVVSLLCLIGAGVAVLQNSRPPKSSLQTSGFDAQEVSRPSSVSARSSSQSSTRRPAAMQTIETGLPSFSVDSAPSASPASGQSSAPKPKGGIDRDLILRETAKLREIWLAQVSRSAVLKAYQKEWGSHADLAALNVRWHKDHDPIAFLNGLSASPNFAKLLFKYAREPDVTHVVMKQIKSVSPDAVAQAAATMDVDSTVKTFVRKLGDAAGIPLGVMLGGAPSSEKDILNLVKKNQQALQNNPANPSSRP